MEGMVERRLTGCSIPMACAMSTTVNARACPCAKGQAIQYSYDYRVSLSV